MKEDLRTREYCLEMLLLILQKGETSHVVIKSTLDKCDDWESARKGFLKKLTLGVLERKEELEYDLSLYMKKGTKKIKPVLNLILLMGAYQILYMDQVYDSKACNLSVELAKKKGFGNLSGFVNGVLRSLGREKENLSYPSKENDPENYLKVRYSMPLWITGLFLSQYGPERTEAMFAGMLNVSKIAVHIKGSLSDKHKEELIQSWKDAGTEVEKCTYLPNAYLLDHVGEVSKLAGFEEGDFFVQDLSAQLAGFLAPVKAGDEVHDLCASPGGKSLYAAEKTGSDGKVKAYDVSERKVERLSENVARMGYANIICEVRDAKSEKKDEEEKADVLLCDVPCSGLGVIGRKPDLKYRLKEEDLISIVSLQKEIVSAGIRDLKKGGFFVYSTCTLNRGENEDMAAWILKNLPVKEAAFETVPEELKNSLIGENCMKVLTAEHGGDGFFIALFEKI